MAGTPQRPAGRRAVHAPMSYTTTSGRSAANAASSTGSTDLASARNRRMAGAGSVGHSWSSVGRVVACTTGVAPARSTTSANPGSTAQLTRWPRFTSSVTTGSVGLTWPWPGMLRKAMCDMRDFPHEVRVGSKTPSRVARGGGRLPSTQR